MKCFKSIKKFFEYVSLYFTHHHVVFLSKKDEMLQGGGWVSINTIVAIDKWDGELTVLETQKLSGVRRIA